MDEVEYCVWDDRFGYISKHVWQCLGMTKRGERCKWNSQTGNFFCKLHQNQEQQLDDDYRWFFGIGDEADLPF
jgi:hypothetical protein